MKLTAKISRLIFISFGVMISSGCVSSETYRAKEHESLHLSRNLDETKSAKADLEEKNKKLSAETEALALQLKKLDAEIAGFRQENEQLKIENEKMSLALKPENILKTLVEAVASLQAENAKLKKEMAAAEKISNIKEPEPPVKLSPVLTRPTAGSDDNSGKLVK